MRFLRCVFFLLIACAAGRAFAQSVRWEAGDTSLGNAVQLVFEDCEPEGEPQLPTVPNATLSLVGRSSSVNIVNTQVSRSVILAYSVQARRGGALQIPAFTVKTNKGSLRVAAFNGAAPSLSAESVATSKLIPERTSVWAGEVFELTYRIAAARRNNPQFGPTLTIDWKPGSLVTEPWGKPSVTESTIDGQRHIVVATSTRVYAKQPERLQLDAAHQVLHVQTGAVGFGFFSQARMEPVSITSDQPTIEVKPLPLAPANFMGAVGQFKLTSKVVPGEASVGEPITWTLELSGMGNWPEIAGLPAREVSKDFQVIQPKAKRAPAEGKLFDQTITEDVVLVPTKPGTYTIGPVEFSVFNPKTGAYETLRTERTTLRIAAGGPTASGGIPAAAAPTTSVVGADAGSKAVAPSAPAGIPRDPLPGSAAAATPLSTRALAAWLLAPMVALVLFWFVLASLRAAKSDPLRPQREARARLLTIITEIRDLQSASQRNPASASALSDRLLAWQRETAVLFGVTHAAPSALAFTKPAGRADGDLATGAAPTSAPPEWVALWRESDRALYAASATLPTDWTARAETALTAVRVRAFNPMRLFRPENLLAFASSVAVLIVTAPFLRAAAPAVSAEAAYRAGNFTAAETAWRQALAERPTDWIARHNLSLALAQQDRSGEAAAHAVAAFIQHPGDTAVRWHFGLTAQKAGFAPAPLMPFLKDGPIAALATQTGPAGWQRLLIAASFFVALAIGWMLWNAYGRRSRAHAVGAAVLCLAAIILGISSIFGVVAYGDLADERAVLTWQAGTLRSIPTEADTTQKTTALPAGSIAIVDKPFLGWQRLRFANGQTGWVRKEETIPLWR